MKISTYRWGCELTAVGKNEWDMLSRLFDYGTMEVGETYEWFGDKLEEQIVLDHEKMQITVNR